MSAGAGAHSYGATYGTSFGTVLKVHNQNTDMWWVKIDENRGVGLNQLVNNIRHMWPEHLERENVVIMKDGERVDG
eukprot:13685209-Ditylum_brightwellii.AAC.1